MNKELTVDITQRLPPVSELKLMPWDQSFGSDYYGAFQVAADYCGLRTVPAHHPGNWQHGTWLPWMKIRPEVIVYGAPKSARCFVARQDEVSFLIAAGYRKVRTIGLPIIYTKPSGLERIPNSLLVMPTHSLVTDIVAPSQERYVNEIASIKSKFSFAAACVSAQCLSKGLWISQFAENGIQVIRGAGIADANALKRMRALFESFEYVTSDSYGSHLYYALYFGAKISIWGTANPILRENVISNGLWTPYPEAIDKLFSEEIEREAEVHLEPLRVNPWIGFQNVDVANSMLGHEHKLSPSDLRAAFGWTPLNIIVESAIKIFRRSPFWRVGSAAKRRLLSAVAIPLRMNDLH